MQTYHHQQQQVQDAYHGQGSADVDDLMAEADWQHKTGGVTSPTDAPNAPSGMDPSGMSTPDVADNPYAPSAASASGPGGASTSANASASASSGPTVDGERVTKRQPAESEAEPTEQRQLFDPASVHPAVRKHSNVVQVSGDPDHHAVETDDDGNVVTDDDGIARLASGDDAAPADDSDSTDA